jgi:ankyrin repeat domain-containing protein 50
MTDPLSVTASIVGLLSLGIQVSEALCRFYTSFKGQDTEIARTVDKLGNLSVIFRSIETALQSRLDDDLTRTIHQSVGNCSDIITELQDEYKHFQAPFPSGIKGTIKASSRRVSYPFRRSTLQKLDEDIQEIRDSLSVALEVLHLGEQKKLQSDITDVKLVLEHIQGSQISSSTRDWLKAPDATLNHNAACAKRYSGTGLWFIEGNCFTTWMTQNNSFLWLSGFAGCGKSVLCSTAIQQTYRQQLLRADVGIAFFYFAFSDESKQDESGMLRALLLQLAGQHQECQTDLNNLHLLYTPGTPPVRVLLEQLRRTVQKFQHVHIFLDALDECPQDGGRDRVLEIVREMREWHLPGLHLLVTSRDELDIRKSLSPSQDEDVVLRNSEIDRDISNFISFQLRTNQHLQKWQNYHDQIQQALSERAQGM